MNYYEFLNKKISANGIAQGYSIKPQVNAGENPFATSLFNNDNSSVKFNGNSIFTGANKEEMANIDYDKVLKTPANNTENVEISPLEYVLKEFFSLDKVKAAADKNSDGEISVEEAKEYVKNLALKDGDGETLSLDDFEKLIKEEGIDLESIANFLEMPEPVQTPTVQPQVSQAPARVSTTRGGGAVRHSAPAQVQPKTVHNMSLPELKSEKANREANLSEKREALKAVQSGNTEGIKSAKAAAENAKKAYEDALKNDSGAKKFAKQIIKNNAKIEKNQVELDKNAQEITAKKSEISEQESTISNSETLLASLEGALSKLPAPSGKPEDREKDAQLSAKKNELTKQISEKKKEVEKQKSQLEKLNKNLEKLNKEKTKLEAEKTKLQAEKAKLDELVNKNCTEATKAKLAQYNKAVQNVEAAKARELSQANSEYQSAQKEVQEINKIISQKEADNAVSKYSDTSDKADKAVELAESQIGVRENGSSNDSAEIRKYKNGSVDGNPWCASFLSWLYGAGQNSNNSETFGYTASSQEIKHKAQNAGCYASINSNYTPQKGDLAMWTKSSSTGHVGIVSKVYPDGSFDTIEGNSSDAVTKHHYSSKHSVGGGFDGFVQMNKWLA